MPKIVRQICHIDANITDSLFRQGQTQRCRGGRMHRFFRVVGFLYICEGSHAHHHATHAIVAAKSCDLCHPDGHHGDSKSRNYMETILRDSHQLYFAHILSNAWVKRIRSKLQLHIKRCCLHEICQLGVLALQGLVVIQAESSAWRRFIQREG